MAKAGGAVKLTTEQANERDQFLCESVALGLPTQFIKDKALADLNLQLDSTRIALMRKPNKNVAKKWHDALAMYSKEFIEGAKGEALLFPVIRSRWMYQVARKCLTEADMDGFFKAMDLGDRFQQRIPGNRILEEYSLSGLVEDVGDDGKGETEEVTFEVVMRRVKTIRTEGMASVRKLLDNKGAE